MAVPAHDQRDYEYMKAHKLDMIEVISGGDISTKAFEKYDYLGKNCKLINSEEFTGMTVEEAKEAITKKLEKLGIGRRVNCCAPSRFPGGARILTKFFEFCNQVRNLSRYLLIGGSAANGRRTDRHTVLGSG